jgi:copper chaperone CopZ
MIKIILKIKKMHCSSCAIRIDGDLEELPGVVSAYTNFQKEMAEVEYDETKVSKEDITKIIELAGYQVE